MTQVDPAGGMLAIPTREWMAEPVVTALIELTANLPPGSEVLFHQEPYRGVAEARNAIVRDFLRRPNLAWLVMCDSDAVPPPHAVQHLLARQCDVVAAECYLRRPPFVAQCRPLPSECRGLAEVSGLGPHFLLIRRHVFELLSGPWFVWEEGWDRSGEYCAGEMGSFCRRARAAGVRLFMDFDIEVGHLAPVVIGRQSARALAETAGHLAIKAPRPVQPLFSGEAQ